MKGSSRPKQVPNKKGNSQPGWGRNSGKDLKSIFEVSAVFLFAPSLVMYYFMTCDSFDCSLSSPAVQIWQGELTFTEYISKLPSPTWQAAFILFIWVFFQAALYLWLPGPKGHGQETPAGHVLEYNTNGLRAWIVTHVLFAVCWYFGILSPTIIYDNWGSLLVCCNVFGFSLAIFAYIKAHFFPTHKNDVKFSGIKIYDFFMGAELNPRIGDFDFKLFFNGRPGILGWNLINLSFMAAQYTRFGHVSNSMLVVTLLQLLYIIDFFYNEDWYLKTIDIAHDHYGWYLAWGDTVWLPWMYTLQGYYLATHPVHLSGPYLWCVLVLGGVAYYVFRSSNDQRHDFRKSPTTYRVWGKPASYIVATYKTMDGVEHQSFLLTSGFWGISRHFNYLADLVLSFSICLACGFGCVFFSLFLDFY
eukprot:TRINITY_DN11895_c0_g2_i2.p1 TRINITY_DN11895_c0_g2~~TRINITY_DN11895_c0_g2_i2.p1  ORF type:complete len:442 (+),score=69.58 TRINITY_DN11895_c0_g2_i2:80-1327(+)